MSAATPTAAVGRGTEARRRSNTELGLLVLAVLVVLCAYALVGLSQRPELPDGLLPYGGALAGAAVVAHIVTRRLAPGGDPLLLPVAFLLNGLGLVMVRRIDLAFVAAGGSSSLAPAQALWSAVAILAFCATLVVLRDYRVLDRYRYLIGTTALVLLLLPLLPVVGREINGARLWLQVAGFTIQPGELAKLGLVTFFASYLAENRQLLSVATNRLGPLLVPPARAFGPVVAVWLISLGVLVFEKDLGLSLLVFGIFVVLLYTATSRVSYVIAATLLFVGGGVFAYQTFAHVQERITLWLNPWGGPEEGISQLGQSLFALATGGIAGVGWGHGQPTFIPAVQTDFIFAAFGEELGLLGTTALLLCFLLMVGRGFRIALRATDEFGTLLATGLTVILGLQAFVILGGVTRLIPLTGLTLPFMSYGGSSLLGNYILIALLLRVSATSVARTGTATAERSRS